MITKIVIARHGNTFRPGETPTRVGAKTDLSLVEERKGRAIGEYLKANGLIPSGVYAAPLLRTMQTAQLAIEEMGVDLTVVPLDGFTEIDYGPDENRSEEEVMLRLGDGDIDRGREVIEKWNNSAIVPPGWSVDTQQIIRTWQNFADEISSKANGEITLLVSSNGIIRFAPYITGNFGEFSKEYDIKVSTGGISIFEKGDDEQFWRCTQWNIKPKS